MKKVLGILVMMLLLTGVVGTLFFRTYYRVSTEDIPKDVPIINGKIVSIKTFRSDELKRGISIVVETNTSLSEVANYYTEEFAKRDIRALQIPTFQGNSRNLETSTDATGLGETQNNQQIAVFIQSKPPLTSVEISILGNSMLSLPK